VEEDVDGGGAESSRGEPDLTGESEGVDGDVEAEQVLHGDDDLGADTEEYQAVTRKDKTGTETPTSAVDMASEENGYNIGCG
ncbi:hypothetical protein MTO96_041075, partial [Rhipicephalus appendiculatus]